MLVVDDDEGIRALVSDLLRAEGYTVVEAASGADALAAAMAAPPEVVVLDVHLPDVSGYEVCRSLRERFRGAPRIIFLSGERTEPHDRVAGLLIGGDDYLVKPFAPDELLARIMSLLRRSTREQRARMSPLTQRELEVLRLLARGLGQTDIAKDLVISPKTVGSHIEHILQKLGVHSRAEAVAVAYREDLLRETGS